MASLFKIHLTVGNDYYHIDYKSIDAALEDKSLAHLLDGDGAECVLWAGELRLTGTPIRSSRELHKALVDHANAILRRSL